MPYAAFGALIILATLASMAAPRKGYHITAAEAHAMTQAPIAINYQGNPYRAGAYVYVMEAGQPTEHDWAGTYIGMQDGMALIRDHATNQIVNVPKDQLYSAQR